MPADPALADVRPSRDGLAHRWELRAFDGNRIEVFMDGQLVDPSRIARKGNHVAVVDAKGTVIERLDLPANWTPEHGKQPTGAYRTIDGRELVPPKTMLGGRLEPVPTALLAHLRAEHTDASGSKCAYVASVIPGLPMAKAGVKAHDIIVTVNGSADASPEAVRAVVKAAGPGDVIRFRLLRAGTLRDVTVALVEWDPKYMVRAVGQKEPVEPATAANVPAPAEPAAMPTTDPALRDELTKARERIAELERRTQGDDAVRKAIRPVPAPQPTATPGTGAAGNAPH